LREQKTDAVIKNLGVIEILNGSAWIDIEPNITSFLGLWLAVCQDTDPFSPADEFKFAFDKSLELWHHDLLHCFDKPSSDIRKIMPSVDGIELLERRQFLEWANQETRRDLLRQLLRWLQLRAILIYYFLNCFRDSSKAETNELHIHIS